MVNNLVTKKNKISHAMKIGVMSIFQYLSLNQVFASLNIQWQREYFAGKIKPVTWPPELPVAAPLTEVYAVCNFT